MLCVFFFRSRLLRPRHPRPSLLCFRTTSSHRTVVWGPHTCCRCTTSAKASSSAPTRKESKNVTSNRTISARSSTTTTGTCATTSRRPRLQATMYAAQHQPRPTPKTMCVFKPDLTAIALFSQIFAYPAPSPPPFLPTMDACQGFVATPYAELDPIGVLVHDLGEYVPTADIHSTRTTRIKPAPTNRRLGIFGSANCVSGQVLTSAAPAARPSKSAADSPRATTASASSKPTNSPLKLACTVTP